MKLRGLTTFLPLLLPLGLLTLPACGDDGGGEDELGDTEETSSTSDSNSSSSGDGDGDNTGDGDGDGDSTGDGDGDNTGDGDGDNTGDGDGDSTGDGDGDSTGDGDGDNMNAGLSVELLLNSEAIVETNNGGALTATCMLFEDGLPAVDQPAFSYAISPDVGVTDNGDSWSFDDYGTWTASCEAMVDGDLVSAEREFSVLNDAIDSRIAALGGALGTSQAALAALLAADGGDDMALIDAIDDLATAAPALADVELELDELADLLIAIPGGYPGPQALTNAGIDTSVDDDALAGALADLDVALDDLAALYASFDPQLEPSQADIDAVVAAGADLDAALDAVNALEPTAHGFIANRQALALSARDHIGPALLAINAYVIARTEAEADGLFGIVQPNPIIPKDFGLLGLTLGMFNQSYIRVKLVNQMYGDIIKDLDKSINNLILNELIDYILPPNPNGPIIDLFTASASQGFAVPGYDTWAYGSGFNSDPAFNTFIILGSQWQGAVDQILNGCGISDDNSVPENVQAINDCVETVEGAIDSAINTPDTVIEPGLLGGQDVHLGPFPDVCDGFLPVATLVIPINDAVGRGETWLTNCLP